MVPGSVNLYILKINNIIDLENYKSLRDNVINNKDHICIIFDDSSPIIQIQERGNYNQKQGLNNISNNNNLNKVIDELKEQLNEGM